MTFNTAKYLQLIDKKGAVFTGGIIDNNPENLIPYQNTPYGRNFRVNGQGISIAPGFIQRGANLGSVQDYPKGISAYLRNNPSNDKIVVNYPYDNTHKLIAIDPTTYAQTTIDTAALITSNTRMNFLNANDSLYCMNGVDLFGKLNGTTYSNPTTGITGFKPSFGVWFDNSMFVSGNPAFPTKMYKSTANSPEDFSGAGSDEFDSNYPVVGLGIGGQTLYVFTESTIDMINNNSIKQVGSALIYTSVPLEATEGSVNHNSIVSVGNSVFYLSKSNKIKRVVPNSQLYYDVIEMSHRKYEGITKTMETLDDDQTASFGYHVPDKQIIKWHCKTKGSTFNDICIIYHYEFDEWMIDDRKVFFGGCWYKSNAYTISQIEPKFYQDEFGTTNDGTPIQFYYETKLLDFGEPTIMKELWQLRSYISINSLAELEQKVYAGGGLVDSRILTKEDIPVDIDGIGTLPIGTYAIGEDGQPDDNLFYLALERPKGVLQVRALNFKVTYSCGTLGAQVFLQRLEPRIEMLNQLTTSTIF